MIKLLVGLTGMAVSAGALTAGLYFVRGYLGHAFIVWLCIIVGIVIAVGLGYLTYFFWLMTRSALSGLRTVKELPQPAALMDQPSAVEPVVVGK